MQIELPGFVLSAETRLKLERVLDQICSPIPAAWFRFDLHGVEIGWMPEHRAIPTADALTHTRLHRSSSSAASEAVDASPLAGILDWRPPDDPSAALQAAAWSLHQRGNLLSWRGEQHALLRDGTGANDEVLRVERSAFRYFGMRSQAAHVNGVIANGPCAGHWWIARRAASKSVDPGKLDNLAAGGVMADEAPAMCAARELGEEAGVSPALARFAVPAAKIHARGVLGAGLHDETVHSYELALPADFVPRCTDGEVAEFLCVSTDELLARLFAGEFTHDAAAVAAATCLRWSA